mmetsp:Transcript_157920/g.506498  ORF Transcript_157920/g.506498 Transcript_157920/m.506498 type:complete len:208 (-) Transcript_157920:1653-2276(-)
MLAKSRITANMQVTSCFLTCSLVALTSPRTMRATTDSGTKRAKASTPMSRRAKACCRAPMSLMQDVCPGLEKSNSLFTREMSRFPNPCIISTKRDRPCETLQPKMPPTLAELTTMARKIRAANLRVLSTRLSASFCNSPNLPFTASSLSFARLSKAPARTTVTTNHRVYLSSFTERVPTWYCRPLYLSELKVNTCSWFRIRKSVAFQ